MSKPTMAERRKAASLYEAGAPLQAVAAELGRSATWVREAAIQHGVLRSHSDAQQLSKGQVEAQRIATELIEEGRLPTREIARRSGLPLRAVRYRMKRDGKSYSLSQAAYLKHWNRLGVRERNVRIFGLYCGGMLQREIGELFGLHQTMVGRIIRQVRDGVPYLDDRRTT